MSGHSKWATIRRSKGANDAKRGQLFTKLGHEIAVAVREGGADPEANFRLRLVLDKAKQANMPKDNIDRAIKRGSGELRGSEELQESVYEGYGPHGTAILVETLSDNKNRTVSEVRRAFTRHGGNLGADGCVAWMFSRKGYIAIDPGDNDPEEIALIAIDSGADDVEIEDNLVQVYTQPENLKKVQTALVEAALQPTEAELSWIPQSTMTLDEKEAMQTMKLIEALEELDDVREVFSNLDITDDLMAKYESAA
ncbi:MAG: YebC/PmpR family DNA-binding transcriptional regulator [Chloroflexi bacterium]|jgi:YebC/PmpR family DNA-binding regulatory protein|nr:YebC/PmpR family DNA-binding transcriptional regulator [Chloroflexota bacterium]